MLYCYVKDGVFERGPSGLPVTWENISNFHVADPELQRAHGWYPYVDVPSVSYDKLLYREDVQYVVGETEVTVQRALVPLEQEETAAITEQLRQTAIARINMEAGACRAKYMTAIPGQEATYLMKEAEAKAYFAAVDPQPTDYPILQAEAESCGMSLAEVAALVQGTASSWKVLAAQIEGLRRGGIVAVETATTEAAIQQALAITWP